MNRPTEPPATQGVEQIWQEQDLKLAQEIFIWGYRLLDDWPMLDSEIATWTARMIQLLRLTPPDTSNNTSHNAAAGDPAESPHTERHL